MVWMSGRISNRWAPSAVQGVAVLLLAPATDVLVAADVPSLAADVSFLCDVRQSHAEEAVSSGTSEPG